MESIKQNELHPGKNLLPQSNKAIVFETEEFASRKTSENGRQTARVVSEKGNLKRKYSVAKSYYTIEVEVLRM